MFDGGRIAIIPDRKRFLVEDPPGAISIVESRESIGHVNLEYVRLKNMQCSLLVRFRLGIVPGANYGKIV